MKRYYCTYFDRNYLVRALALFDSLNRHENCEFEVFAVCMDELSRILLEKLQIANVTAVAMHEIELRDDALLKAKHERSLVEYYWTSTATIILRLLERHRHIDCLSYLDADLFFYTSPQAVFDEMGQYSVLIHEHRFSASQRQSIVYGKYNVGMLVFRNNPQALAVLKHWRQQCLDWCYFRIENNKIGDQKYLDDWPQRYAGVVGEIKNIGAGLGPWNHDQYRYSHDKDGRLLVEGGPAVFYHFHGLKLISPDIVVPLGPSYHIDGNILYHCFLPYLNSLRAQIAKLRQISPGFSFGLAAEADLTQQRCVLAHRSADSADKRLALGHAAEIIDAEWTCYGMDGKQHANRQSPLANARVSDVPVVAEARSEGVGLLWPSGRPVSTPDDILHALRGRPISRRIRTLYVVGAFQFEERELLFSLFPQLQTVYLFEPTPEAFERLKQITDGDPRVSVFPYAIADENGESEFHISNNWQSSSLLAFGKHRQVFPGVETTRTITVAVRTLDSVMQTHTLQPPDMLFLDVQGAENKIMSSLSKTMRARIQLIYTEASTEELYIGSGTLDDLRQGLAADFHYLGFAPTRNETPMHGNALFVNRQDMAFMGPLESTDAGMNSSQSADQPPDVGPELLAEGEILANEGNYLSALEVFQSALKTNPQSAQLHNNIGVMHHALGNPSQAIVHLSRAIEADPHYKNAIMNCANILSGLGKFDVAKQLVDAYLEQSATDAEALAMHIEFNEKLLADWVGRSEQVDTNFIAKPYKVSVIVSTYQSAEFMRECLEDLESQSIAEDLEIIVLDAASPENERAIVEEFQQRYHNIRYLRTPERIGIYLAWNMMIYLASSPYITPFSTNDRLRKQAYQMMYEELERNGSAMVYGNSLLTSRPHERYESNSAHAAYQWPPYSLNMLLQNCLVGPNPMWRRSVHRSIGYFDDSYVAIGDQEFWCRMGLHYDIRHLNEYTGLHWITKDSLSGNHGVAANEIARYQQKYAPFVGHKHAPAKLSVQ